MAIRKFDIAVVGHFAIDNILLPNRTSQFVVLGGAATYTSFSAKRLGVSTTVISKVGDNFPEVYKWRLKQEGIDLSGVTKVIDEQTTCFELKYNKDLSERSLKLKSKAPPINTANLPDNLEAEIIHVAPIVNEVSYDLIECLKEFSGVLSLDPQGLLRSFDEAGNVIMTASVDKQVLSLIDIYKSSIDEIHVLTGKSELKHAIKYIHDFGVDVIIVTLGAKGAVISVEGALHNIAICPSRVIVDPTGAGDVFIGAFLTEYLREKEPVWCASVGAAAASFVVEGIGSTYFGEKEEVYQRANALYEKEIKQ